MTKKSGGSQHQIASRVNGDAFHTLTSVAAILGQTQAETLDKALSAFVATLPADTRRAVAAAIKASRQHCAICNG
jgi:hypothetical protein